MIDLDDIASLCPGLPVATGEPLVSRAVIALQRRHKAGVELLGTVRGNALHISPEAAASLEALRSEANAALDEASLKAPLVQPIRYTLHQDAA